MLVGERGIGLVFTARISVLFMSACHFEDFCFGTDVRRESLPTDVEYNQTGLESVAGAQQTNSTTASSDATLMRVKTETERERSKQSTRGAVPVKKEGGGAQNIRQRRNFSRSRNCCRRERHL